VKSFCRSLTVWIIYDRLKKISYLEHRGDATSSGYHSDVLEGPWFHEPGLFISKKELRVAFVDDVTTNTSNPHFCPIDHAINKLSKEASLRVLKVPQVDFNQEVNIAAVHNFGQRMIKPCLFLL
jgi:hypothetical protein